MKKDEFIEMIVKNHKSKQWLNGTFQVEEKTVGVKAFGKWVQVLTYPGFRDGSTSDIRSVKAFREEVERLCENI